MKKTLITLMALVGVASATTPQSVLTLSNVDLGELAVIDISTANLTTTDGFTIMLTLDFKSASNGPAMWFSKLESTHTNVGTSYEDSVATIGWGSPNYQSSYRLSLFTTGGSAGGVSTSADAISGSTTGDPVKFRTTAFVTYSGGTATLYEINSDGELLQTGSTTYSSTETTETSVKSLVLGNWAHNGVNATGNANIALYSGVLSQKAMNELLIPEPTTASLSLLALAGLAARRRRK